MIRRAPTFVRENATVADDPTAGRARLVVSLVLALTAASLAVLAIGPWPAGVFQDDGIYVVLAKSLATGEGYRYLQMPGAPHATHYPPMYPLLLAGLWKAYPVFPENVTLFKFANAGLLGVAAALFHHFARRRLRLAPMPAALGVLVFTACAPVVLLTVMVLSEPLFLVVLAVSLLAAERAVETGRPRDAALAGVLAAILALVRTLGIAIAPATALVLVWRGRWRSALVLSLSAIVVVLPWQLWVDAHSAEVPRIFLGKYGSYAGWLTDAVRTDGWGFVPEVAWANLKSLVAQGWASTATDTLPASVRNTASIALALFFGIGLATLGRRAAATATFVAMYLAIVLIWPFAPARFTWGIWPLVGLVYTLAVMAVLDWRRPPLSASAAALEVEAVGDVRTEAPLSVAATSHRRPVRVSQALHAMGRGAALSVLALLALGYADYNVLGTQRHWWTVVQRSVADRARPLAEWVAANTDSTAIIATDDDVLIHLYTGRRTIPTGAFTAREHLVAQTPAFAEQSLRTILATYRVDYVLASTSYGTYAVQGLVASRPPLLRIVQPLQTGAVFAPIERETGR